MSTLQHTTDDVPIESIKTDTSQLSSMWFLIPGIALMTVGLAAITLPLATALAAEMILGALMLLGGVGYGIHALKAQDREGVVWSIGWGILYGATGILLLAFPLSGLVTLTLVLALLFVIEGISKLLLAVRLSNRFNRRWLALDGIVGAGLGVLIWSQWPSDAAWVVGVLVGIRFLIAGAVLISFAFAVKELRVELEETVGGNA
jgi:uncharacterized membrane protein HdeD (DUF308 family)